MSSYEECLKRATSLKKTGDIQGAVRAIDDALGCSQPGTGSRPQAWKKRIYYLLLDRCADEAPKSADRLIKEALLEAGGDEALLGTAYSFAYRERARVLIAKEKPREALADFLRAAWHWHGAMVLQERSESEFPPEVVADSLQEAVAACGYDVGRDELETLVRDHIASRDSEAFVLGGLTTVDQIDR